MLSLCFLQPLLAQKKTLLTADRILFEQAVAIQQLADEELDPQEKETEGVTSHDDSLLIEHTRELQEKIRTRALQCYKSLLEDFPQSKLRFRALNNRALLEYQLKDYDEAKQTYLSIVNSKADDKELGGVGSGLMGEPYANYKNRAAKMIAEICLRDSNYQEALNFLSLTKQYPYRHFCGNEYAADDMFMAMQLAKCYLGLNDYKKAYSVLLPRIIENGLANNHSLVKLTVEALLKTYTKTELRISFQKAIQSYSIEEIDKKDPSYITYYINFLDNRLRVDNWMLIGTKPDEQAGLIRKSLEGSYFYQLIAKD